MEPRALLRIAAPLLLMVLLLVAEGLSWPLPLRMALVVTSALAWGVVIWRSVRSRRSAEPERKTSSISAMTEYGMGSRAPVSKRRVRAQTRLRPPP